MNEKLISIKILFFSLIMIFIASVTFADQSPQTITQSTDLTTTSSIH